METIRDERLDEALTLLQRSRRTRPGYMPLLTGCAFIGAATFLAYVVTKSPVLTPPAVASPKAMHSTPEAPAQKADFDLSGSAASEPAATEAVLLGTEQSR